MKTYPSIPKYSEVGMPKTSNCTAQLVEDVKNGRYNVFEGVVAKGGNSPKNMWMIKIKTKKYLKKLKGGN
jgi:hypothetical protein